MYKNEKIMQGSKKIPVHDANWLNKSKDQS